MNMRRAIPPRWDLRFFQEIAQTQSLSRASERLGVSQPALSLSLKRLEESLQVELFVRLPKGLQLTEAGHRLRRETNHLLEQWQSIVTEVRRSKTEITGTYTLGCHPSVAMYALKDFFKKVHSEQTELDVQIHHGLSREICERVISGQLDFGLVVNPIRNPNLVITPLGEDIVSFFKTKHSPEDVLIYNPLLLQSQALLKKLGKKHIFRRTLSSDNLELIATWASAGTGVAILPSRVAKAHSHNLEPIKSWPTFRDSIALIHRFDLPQTGGTTYLKAKMRSLTI